MSQDSVLEVIDALYAAALEPEAWDAALAAVSDCVGAIGVTIVPIVGDSTGRSIASASLAEANEAYRQTWWRHDTPTSRILTRGLKPGSVGTDRVVMDEAEIRRDPFYQEFLRHYGIGSSLAAVTPLGSGTLFSIAAQRSLTAEPFERDEVERMATLSPHIGRAVSVAMALADARRMASDLANAVERLAWGVIVLDAQGHAKHVNATALALLGDGLAISQKVPRASLRADDARLQAAVRAALPGSAHLPGAGVLLRRPSGEAPLYVEVVPIRSQDNVPDILAHGAGGAMLLVRSLAGDAQGVAPHLRSMGLTPAEARVAEAVGEGTTLRAAAEQLGITYETARTHLRAVFAKLGLRRQAELVALITRLGASVAAP